MSIKCVQSTDAVLKWLAQLILESDFLSHISENWVVKHYANEIDISVYLLNIIVWSCCYYMLFIVFGMYNLNSILILNILFCEILLLLPEFQLSKSTGINFTDHKAVNKTCIKWTV